MDPRCVHGFPPEHCSQCRICPHGLATSRCGRCNNAVAQRAAAKRTPPAQPTEVHRGFEIFFVPQERSWYYRKDADAPLSRESYRSAFQARLAINAELDQAAEPARAGGKKN
jgi:hypothetical protein